MALKSTTAPLDQRQKAEWRAALCTYKEVTFADQSSAWQTECDRIIDEAFEYLSQRAGHHPWGQQETTLTITAGTDTTYSMPAAFRHLIAIHEVATDGALRRTYQADKKAYYDKIGTAGVAAHPWTLESVPYWFYDGMTADEPPVQQWRRIGTDNESATAYVLFRPYFNLLTTAGSGQNDWPYLPAAESSALLERMLYKLSLYERDFDAAQMHKAAMEDEINALERNDRVTVEDPIQIGVDSEFRRLLG